jgi:3-phenylpropionate/trans-cinnamate dioxygenase ferredoxin reductase subunit
MTQKHFSTIIIGAGQAGSKLAEALRAGGYQSAICLIGAENTLPYQRPPLSKAFLAGEMAAQDLMLKPAAFYQTKNIDVLLGAPVSTIDPAAQSVTIVDKTLTYDTLVLATGTRAARPPFKGAEALPVIRTMNDVEAIAPAFKAANSVLIIGAGYIGLEVAAVARKQGKAVILIDHAERALARSAALPMASYLQTMHESNGVHFMFNKNVEEAGAQHLTLQSGETLHADLVLLAAGAAPNTELADAAGLDVRDGIEVDAFGRTSDSHIYAIGDCANFPSTLYGRRIRLESVQNAIDHAKAVAQVILGKPKPYDPVPWFWSDQYDAKLQQAGLSIGYDEALPLPAAQNSFCVAYGLNGKLIGVDTINAPRLHLLARRAIGGSIKEFAELAKG